ncbi:MAG: UDP-N-acetylmuramoyl-L-alanyl-D-glutamate--2,6-diaminopimelate ligase [Alphaproteobacteria bacterium]|nr:MAG: UDP-N-acetylmuramoyl-L-alanyl-D-glutamate--2,6-diaminopimelate ligase [Alphaproteobacteria bacterium]
MSSGPATPPGNPRGPPVADPDIIGITADSRQVKAGYLFAALRGTQRDGRAFATEAAAKGAAAILTDDADALPLDPDMRRRVAIIADPNPQRRLALLAARFYGRQPRTVAAVTGTNGKTSVAHFTREIWSSLGHPAASLGTLGLVLPSGRRPGALTTPDPIALHRDLAELATQGIEHAAIEASSHGLAQYRLDGVAVSAAAFTNLTRDHLDYHGDMASYRAAKQRLFRDLLRPDGDAIINADSPEFDALAVLCRDRGHRVIGYGSAASAELSLLDRVPTRDGQQLRLSVFMQRVGETATGAPVFVDYAHTPDALATVLSALRPHAEGRLAVVFGAGGDRDRGKRPQMGQVASELADLVYVTDDNPRSEPPQEIRRAILAAAPNAVEIGDRREAITAAIAELRRGDILVIAGKGHETGQIIGNTTLPFDDAAVAHEIIAAGLGR